MADPETRSRVSVCDAIARVAAPSLVHMKLHAQIESWPLRAPFRIAGRVFTELDVLVVTLRAGELSGRGEAAGVYYTGDTPQRMIRQLENVQAAIEGGIDRAELTALLPPGGARNAVDCALWDLEAKLTATPAWMRAQLSEPRPLMTTYTLSADSPTDVAQRAIRCADARALKIKLDGGKADLDRVRAVREARPDAWLAVDANQALDPAALERALPTLVEADVQLIEQPFAIGREADLDGLASPIPIAADESIHTLEDLPALIGRFDVVNIKLDKCGGLTDGLELAHEVRRQGLRVMVGNMSGTSLATAPAFLLGQLCDVVDLDGPLLLASDRSHRATYRDGFVACTEDVWGGREPYGRV